MVRPRSSLRRLITIISTTGALLGGVAGTVPAHADGPGQGSPWVVSVGDSYISGEAGRWAGNTDDGESGIDALGPTAYYDNPDHTAEQIHACHRSRSAEIYIGGGVNGYNLACSGAETTTTADALGDFKPGLDFYSDGSEQGQALMLQHFAAAHNVKMVAVSIGGNDFDFATVVAHCVADFLTSPSWLQNNCDDDSSVTSEFTAANIATQTAAIAQALRNVRQAMANAGYADSSYTILVQDYPSPMPPASGFRYSESGFTRQSTGGCGFWDEDADWANSTALPSIDAAVANAVTASGLTNVATMRLSSVFNSHRLCENTVGLQEEENLTSWTQPGAVNKSEWVNQIRTVTAAGTDYFIQESFHPNYWGQLALRNCLRQAYNAGTPHGGRCTIAGTGTNANGEPVMRLS